MSVRPEAPARDAVQTELASLAEDWWAFRRRRAPRSRDDIPRVVRPEDWRPSWTREDVAADLARATEVQARLAQMRSLDRPDLEVPLRLLESATARVRWEVEILASWRRDPWFYLDQSLGHVYDVLLSPAPFDAARTQAVVERLRWIPATLEQSRENLAGSAFRELAELALADSAAAADQVREAIERLAPSLPDGSGDEASAAAASAAEAVRSWRDWLRNQLPGLPRHCPVGGAGFGFYLHRVALLPWSAEEILVRARQERDRAEAFELFERARSGPAVLAPADETATEQAERERLAELEVRAFYERRGLLSQPEFLRHYTNLPRPAYLEPLRWLGVSDDLTDETRLDQDGVSYVPAPGPDLPYFYRANAADPRAGIVHEGAHYQQLALSWRHPDVAHRHFYDSTPNEGIAFYNEEMLLQAGLFDDAPVTRAIVYNFMRLRAIRVEVDVRLALGEIGIEEAAQVLERAVPMDRDTAADEAAFFAATPGQGLSYQTGKSQLLGLLADCARRDGEGFDLRGFHDALWNDGNIPLAVQRLQLLDDASELRRADELARLAEADPGVASHEADVRTLAERLMAAILSGDAETVARIYADDVVVWHNTDGIERDKAYSVEAVRRMAREFDHFSASDLRIELLPDGYFQRCVFQIRWRGDDRTQQAHAAMRVTVRDGQVARIEEYTDSAQGQPPVPAAPGTGAEPLATGRAEFARFRDGTGWERAAGYSRAARHGDLVAVSGTTAHGPDGVLHPGDTYRQALACLHRAVAAAEKLGAHRETVVRSRLLLAPGADWEAAARAHAEVLGDVAPANTTLYVGALVGEGFLVEVELDALAVDDDVADGHAAHGEGDG
ncbi:MAG: DUF885 family protein [Motilibacteraceae bacterium]